MLESERLAYLNALGIAQYVAQDAIAGAKVLPELAPEAIWPAAIITAAEPVVQDAAAELHPDQQPGPEIKKPIVAEPNLKSTATVEEPTHPKVEDDGTIPQLDVGKLKQEQEQPKSAPVKAVVKVQRFALAVITVPEQFRLFVELAVPDAPGLSAVEHRMVSDLLALLGHPAGLDQFGAKLYRWPMVSNPRIAADPQAARDGLLGFVASAPAVEKNVFIGRKAASILNELPLGQPFVLNGSSSDDAAPDTVSTADSIAVWSLADMQSDWANKIEAWRSIHPFLIGSA